MSEPSQSHHSRVLTAWPKPRLLAEKKIKMIDHQSIIDRRAVSQGFTIVLAAYNLINILELVHDSVVRNCSSEKIYTTLVSLMYC